MDFEYSERAKHYLQQLNDFMQAHVLPANHRYHELASQGKYPLEVIEPLKARA